MPECDDERQCVASQWQQRLQAGWQQEPGSAACWECCIWGTTKAAAELYAPWPSCIHCHHEHYRRHPQEHNAYTCKLSESCLAYCSCVPFILLHVLYNYRRMSTLIALCMCCKPDLSLQPLLQGRASEMCQASSMMWKRPHWTISTDGVPAWGPSCGRWSSPRSTSILLSGANQQLLTSQRAP